MSAPISRCSMQLTNPHERRRGAPKSNLGPIVYGTDLLHSTAYWRRVRRTCPHASAQYAKHREAARVPTLGQLRMIEAAIGCDVACRDAVRAWRGAA